MIDHFCEICKEINSSDNWCLHIYDDKDGSIHINAHKSCIDKLDDEIKAVKDYRKKSVDKVLKEIKFSLK